MTQAAGAHTLGPTYLDCYWLHSLYTCANAIADLSLIEGAVLCH